MPKKEKENNTPNKLIKKRFDRLIKNAFFYNKEVFTEKELSPYEEYVLSDRASAFSVAYGNRLLLSHIIPTSVIQEYIPTNIESYDRVVDDEDDSEYQGSIFPEPGNSVTPLDDVLESERTMLIHELIGKLHEHISDDDVLEECIYRKELMGETWTGISSDLDIPRTTLYGQYSEGFERIKEIFSEKYLSKWNEIKEI